MFPVQLSVAEEANTAVRAYTGSVLIECFARNCGRPTNAQRCSNQTKTKEDVQLSFGSRPHLNIPKQKLGHQGSGDVTHACKSYLRSTSTLCPNI